MSDVCVRVCALDTIDYCANEFGNLCDLMPIKRSLFSFSILGECDRFVARATWASHVRGVFLFVAVQCAAAVHTKQKWVSPVNGILC